MLPTKPREQMIARILVQWHLGHVLPRCYNNEDEQAWSSEVLIVVGNDEPEEVFWSKFALIIVSFNIFDLKNFSSLQRLA